MRTIAPDAIWEGAIEVDESVFRTVLRDTALALESSGIEHVFIGGIASAALGRPRWTHDIDVFVRPEHAHDALGALEREAFDTQETDRGWLFKATKNQVLVDVIFRSAGSVELDSVMLRRSVEATFVGIPLRVIAPEDLIVIKALVHKERVPRHWHDALALIAQKELDWDYLVWRAQHSGPWRVLSLLCYARSNDLVVPEQVIRALLQTSRKLAAA